MAVGLQLLQVVTPLFHANALGVPLQAVSINIGNLTVATWFALFAISTLVFGIWCSQLGSQANAARIRSEVWAWSPRSAFVFCLITLVAAGVSEAIGESYEGLRQPCLAAGQIQWLGVFLLACVCSGQRRGYGYLAVIAGLEVVKGFTGYFGEFKSVFVVLLIGMFSIRPIRPIQFLFGSVVGVTLLLLASFWSAVKMDYRAFISAGVQAQVVVVPIEERLSFLAKRGLEADWETMSDGLDSLLKRLGYLDYLSATIRNVPSRVPFQEGAQIGGTILHVLQPRLLFPDKPSLPDDTEVLSKYTGIYFGRSTSLATSVSLGYLAELYVDFGFLGAIFAMFVIGLALGRVYRFLCSPTSLPAIVTFGLGVMLCMSVAEFGQAFVKTVGSFLTTLAVALILKSFVLPTLLTFIGLRQKNWSPESSKRSGNDALRPTRA
jgi:hypothetical protein